MNPASEFKIIYRGVFTEEDFHYDVMPGKRKYKAETRHLIKQAWQDAKLNPDLNIFNGPVVSLLSAAMINSHETDRDSLFLKVQMSDYKSFYGTNVCNTGPLLKTELTNALAACAVVETTDGTVFVGRRSEKLAETSGLWHIPGGTLSEAINPIEAMRRELSEELNISTGDIQSAVCLGFAENLLMKKPEFLCYFHLKLTERQVTTKMADAVDLDEHDEFVFVPLEELQDFTEIHLFAPIGKAAIQLYLSYISRNHPAPEDEQIV
jgi:8-oxo-dGTP pyrophosphatase MutT (NUDIX family)